jgi:hypothetical protein
MAGNVHDTRQRFDRALEALVDEVRQDRTVLAAVLCGSLSHDVVWQKSDIDLVLVSVDDPKSPESYVALNAHGVNVHASVIQRTAFRRLVEGATHNSFMHSLLSKGRLLYTHDPSIAGLFEGLRTIGERDSALQLLRAGTHALPCLDKAHKWFVTRGDLDYTALWILYAATPLAQIEVIGRGLLADREVIPQAVRLNPAFFSIVYTDLLNAPKTRERVAAALDAADAYMAERAPSLFRLVLEYLREAGEARSCTEIEAHFKRSFDVDGVTTACEYLADRNLIGKAGTPMRLTRRSHVEVQELAFYDPGGPEGGRP